MAIFLLKRCENVLMRIPRPRFSTKNDVAAKEEEATVQKCPMPNIASSCVCPSRCWSPKSKSKQLKTHSGETSNQCYTQEGRTANIASSSCAYRHRSVGPVPIGIDLLVTKIIQKYAKYNCSIKGDFSNYTNMQYLTYGIGSHPFRNIWNSLPKNVQ